jgi:hypothetical protein
VQEKGDRSGYITTMRQATPSFDPYDEGFQALLTGELQFFP